MENTEGSKIEYSYTEDYNVAETAWKFGDTVYLTAQVLGVSCWIRVRRTGLDFPVSKEVHERCRHKYRIARYI